MTVKVETYYNISEKEKDLAAIYREHRDKAVFIVPGSFDKELLCRMVSEEGSFFGSRPVVWTWSDLYKELTRVSGAEYLRAIDPHDHNLIINYVLKNYLSEAKNDGYLPPGVKRKGFYSLLGDNLRELMDEEILPEDIRRLLGLYGRAGREPEAILCRLYEDYLAYLDTNRIADGAQIPTLTRMALSSIAGQCFVSGQFFVFVGFLTFTGGQRRLVEAVGAAAQECWAILPETGIYDYYDGIKQLGADYGGRPQWSVGVWRILASGEYAQFEALARELALWLAGRGDLSKLPGRGAPADYGEIGVLVDPRGLRALQNALSRYKIPYGVHLRESARNVLAWQLLREIWGAWDSGWAAGKTLSMLTNPLLGSGYGVSEYEGKFPEGRDSWLSELKGKALNRFVRAERFCLALERGGVPSDLIGLWRDFLNGLEPGETLSAVAGQEIFLDRAIRDTMSVLRELDKTMEALRDTQRNIGEASNIKLAGSDAVAYLLDWGGTAKLPLELPQSCSITLYAGVPPALSSHKYWVMTGIDYNSWPGTLRESPLLRDAAKKIINGGGVGVEAVGRLHMPEVRERRRQKEALFRRLIATAECGVILTRSVTDQSGRPVGESQFAVSLFDVKKNNVDRCYVDLGRTEYPASRMLPRSGDIWFPASEALSWSDKLDRGVFPRSIRDTAGREKAYVSLSSLDDWKKCPFFYWCRWEARLAEPRRGIYDHLRSGSMVHKLWEICWRKRLEKNISISQLVAAHWDEVVRREYPELVTDGRLRRYERDLNKQALALAETQDAVEERIRDRKAVELEYTLPAYEIDGVVFLGRADRIDFFDGGAVVLDYKAGSSVNAKRNGSLQLAAYAAVLREQNGLAPYGVGWFGLRDALLSGFWNRNYLAMYRANARKINIDMEEKADNALHTMREMAAALNEGIFTANYAHTDCKKCVFSTLCRRKEYPLYQLEDEAGEGDGDEQR